MYLIERLSETLTKITTFIRKYKTELLNSFSA